MSSLPLAPTALGALQTAALLVCPGYGLTLLLWPRSQDLLLPRRIALTPCLSILAIVLLTGVAWSLHVPVRGDVVRVALVGSSFALIGGGMLRAWRADTNDYAGSYRDVGAALALFVALAFVGAALAQRPTSTARTNATVSRPAASLPALAMGGHSSPVGKKTWVVEEVRATPRHLHSGGKKK